MSGSSNFQQWNPFGLNQETDAAYTSDSLRTGGAPTNAIFASPLANKAFYQWSTFIAAFAASLALKGYVLSDANLATLTATLGDVITGSDIQALNLNQSLYRNNNFATHVGTVTEDVLFSYALGAGVVMPNSIIRITLRMTNNLPGGTGDNLIRLHIGGVALTAYSLAVPGENELTIDILLPGSFPNSKVLAKGLANSTTPGFAVAMGNLGNSTVNLSLGTTLEITVQASGTTVGLLIESALIQLL